MKAKKKLASIPSLTRKLDSVFSRYIRMKYADEGGTVSCVTCGKLMHWKDAHAGHFVSRRHMSARWYELNVHPQCCGCNTFKDGALDEYSGFILREYGNEIFDQLLGMKREVKKWTRAEITDLIHWYESAARDQASRIGAV